MPRSLGHWEQGVAPASNSEDAGQREAAGVVEVALPAGVLLQPAQHDVAPAPVLEAVGRVQDIAQVQRKGPCASAGFSGRPRRIHVFDEHQEKITVP